MISLRKINKIYAEGTTTAVHAVRDLSIEIKQGEFLSIQGPSGCGKTTLFNIIGLIDQAGSGEHLLNNTKIESANESSLATLRNTIIGFVLQDFALIQGETALYNVALPVLIAKKGRLKNAKAKALESMKLLKIEDLASKKVRELSGGQKQRVAIARAMVQSPKIILADEPTGSLDQETSHEVMNTLIQIHEKEQVTLIVVTHDPLIAKQANRQIHMLDGQITMDTQYAADILPGLLQQ